MFSALIASDMWLYLRIRCVSSHDLAGLLELMAHRRIATAAVGGKNQSADDRRVDALDEEHVATQVKLALLRDKGAQLMVEGDGRRNRDTNRLLIAIDHLTVQVEHIGQLVQVAISGHLREDRKDLGARIGLGLEGREVLIHAAFGLCGLEQRPSVRLELALFETVADLRASH